ncbi:hypothetical protein SH668x_001229 [Planctomicrobium sp. SH668]|uniref:hypothetical protein n=1 Tax=Planctomicrobium sp. SH668 TaxID=3448126 RepID=UPI003F5BBF41
MTSLAVLGIASVDAIKALLSDSSIEKLEECYSISDGPRCEHVIALGFCAGQSSIIATIAVKPMRSSGVKMMSIGEEAIGLIVPVVSEVEIASVLTVDAVLDGDQEVTIDSDSGEDLSAFNSAFEPIVSAHAERIIQALFS